MSATQALRIASVTFIAAFGAATTACKESSISEVPVDVARIDFSTGSVSIDVGSTTTVTATPKSGSGKSLTARGVQFSSSNPSVVQVTPSGQTAQLTGVSAGSATVTATSGSANNSVSVTVTQPNITLNIENNLLSPVEISVNGSLIGTVGARPMGSATATAATFQIPHAPQFTLDWDLVRPVIQNTTIALGEAIGGRFEITTGSDTEFDFVVDNEIAGTIYFAPVITNNTAVRLLMGVNFGLSSENRCNCVVPENSTNIYFGYYEMTASSNVRGYADGSNYTGTYVFWTATQIMTNIQTLTGITPLLTNVTPSPGVPTVAGSVSAAVPVGIALPVRSAETMRR